LVKGPDSGYVNLNIYCAYDQHIDSNITPVQDMIGPDGEANSAWTLTATAANGTIKHTPTTCVTATNYAHTVWLKRVTGTGHIDLTIDDGGTWTTKTLTTSWQQFFVTKSAANPIIGIRIVDDTDSVAAWWPNITQSKYPLPNIYSNGSQVAQAPETVKSDISTNAKLRAALSDAVGGATSEGTMTCEWTPGFDYGDLTVNTPIISARDSAFSLLYVNNGSRLVSYDGTTQANQSDAITRDVKHYIAVRWSKSGNKLQVGVGISPSTIVWGTAVAYDGAFILGNDLHIGYNNEYPFEIKNLKFFDVALTDLELPLAFY